MSTTKPSFPTISPPASRAEPLACSSRSRLRYAADAYSVSLGYDISSALVKMSTTNLENLDPDPLDSLLNLSHPTTVQRVATVRQLIAQREGRAKKRL
jgi:hypothetical protein